ncbi:MAG: hypothetical protein LBH74_08990, partial [Nitrososphaerota archaeon]|nr:hypothetical protein [Nitrososphaerota archaeon]
MFFDERYVIKEPTDFTYCRRSHPTFPTLTEYPIHTSWCDPVSVFYVISTLSANISLATSRKYILQIVLYPEFCKFLAYTKNASKSLKIFVKTTFPQHIGHGANIYSQH